MGGEIQSSTQDASSAAQLVTDGLGDYCSFHMTEIAGYAPVMGSTAHDGMSGRVSQAFSTWQTLLESDAQAIVDTGAALDSADADSAFALSLLGIGAGNV